MSGNNHRQPTPFRHHGAGTALVALDRLGRPLKAGQIVMYRQNLDLIVQIVSITPVLHPGAPPGAMQIILHTDSFPHVTQAGQPIANMVIVGQGEVSDEQKEPASSGLIVQ